MRLDTDRAIVAAGEEHSEVVAQLNFFDELWKELTHDPPADTVQLAHIDGGDQRIVV
jgi:hypothetical protein